MAYFVPSYFQKRLLRYILTRIDFIDTDEIDLDNLGIRIGQRSVIELKNVGIKVDKLTQTLQLPNNITLRQASLKLLRLTIPADLHISGIEVEVDGVEISVRLSPASDTGSTGQPAGAPNRKDVVNRPRIAPTSMHDPGGVSGGLRGSRMFDIQPTIPSSDDLAASFLQAESAREKAELQRVIETQSQSMQGSYMSSSLDNEAGLGMPGGFSLPGFVANFFQGVADRLSVVVKNVAVLIELSTSASIASRNGGQRFIFKVTQISLSREKPSPGTVPNLSPRKSVNIAGIQFCLLSEVDTFSPASSRGSPRLGRTSPKSSSVPSFNPPTSSFLEDSILNSPLESFRQFGSQSGHEQSSESDRSNLARTRPSQDRSIPEPASVSSLAITGKGHSEDQSVYSQTTQSRMTRSRRQDDLTASRMFSHDEAESLYLSAVSNGGRRSAAESMPGSWDVPSAPFISRATVQDPPNPTAEQLNTSESSDDEVEDKSDYQTPKGTSPPRPLVRSVAKEPKHFSDHPFADSVSQLVSATILKVTYVRLTLPQPVEEIALAEDTYEPRSMADQHRRLSSTRSSTNPSTGAGRTAASDGMQSAVQVEIGDIEVNLDINIGKLLIRTTQEASKVMPPNPALEPPAVPPRPLPALNASIQGLKLKFWEYVDSQSVGEFFEDIYTANDSESALTSAMLCLSLTRLEFQQSLTMQYTKRFTISKLSVHHHELDVLSCLDKINVRDSIAGSSILRPHDVIVTDTGGRLEVQIKPVHLTLDLSIIDDVLGRSGGLSSLLELGNSIASPQLVPKPTLSAPITSNPRPRTVRFDSPQGRPRSVSDSASSPIKVDFRLSGLLVELIQANTMLRLRSSAIKTVYRQDQVRVAIDGVVLEGPIFSGKRTPPELNVKLRDIKCHYLYVPEEVDLDRLLSLLTPSNNKYDEDDDIMVETLLRQRTKGAVMRLSVNDLQIGMKGLDWINPLSRMSDELVKLSTVAKYLPEDDRPGILTFGLVDKLNVQMHLDDQFGPISLRAELLEGAHISVPSLSSAQISTWSLTRGETDLLIGEVTPHSKTVMAPPMFMCRFIADEMEPTVRIKLFNMSVEYKVPMMVDITALLDRLKAQFSKRTPNSPQQSSSPTPSNTSDSSHLSRKIRLSVTFKDSGVSLNPENSCSKGIFLLTDAVIVYGTVKGGSKLNVDLRKASLLVIDDKASVGQDLGNPVHKLYFDQSDQVQQLTQSGFVPIGYISSAACDIRVEKLPNSTQQQIDVELRNNLIYLESCADSTQTMIQILSGLAPPTPPSKIEKFRTEVVPIQDLLASFTGDAFVTDAGPEHGLSTSQLLGSVSSTNRSDEEDEDEDEDENDGFTHYLDSDESDDNGDELTASYVESHAADSTPRASVNIAAESTAMIDEADPAQSVMASGLLDFRSDHFNTKSSIEGTAHRWDSTRNTYGQNSDSVLDSVPLKVRIRDVHVIWNLFDGYDWQSTRDTISQAVKNIETRATAKRNRSDTRYSSPVEDDEESEIGDFLFNSIYIGIPANRDPRELANAINHDIDDLVSETGSYATRTTATVSPTPRQSSGRPKKLRLQRSKQHKITFELEGVSADIVVFPPDSGEVESSLDVRVRKLEVFDHIPTSTWKKFATYMHDAGEREVDTSQVHVELLTVKPIAELSASEIVLKATILPLRLHIDQDALDFMTRFFEFKDERAPPSSSPSMPAFIQRAEISPVRLRLDFKPKRVDYGGLRSGRTTEFMNFFVLDRADIVLRRIIVYGVSGFDRLGIMLNNIWTPDVKRNQLPTVLAGLAPLRPIVDVSSGLRELVAVPIREYRKDGRIVRSIQKGAIAFAKTTATELVNLGAKMAIGTQQVLQNAEEMLVPSGQNAAGDLDEETKKQISLYADQPVGIVQGLRGAYASLERDLLLARDAIVAVPGEIMATGSATGAAKVILKQSPTIILRPAIGATKAVGQTLLGAGNTLDRANLRRMEEKYKRH